MTIPFASTSATSTSVPAIALLTDLSPDAVVYDHPDRSYSPFWSNIGLSFGSGQGIGALHLHYNRRTVTLAGPALGSGAPAAHRRATIDRVEDDAVRLAFFATDSFIIESSAPLSIGFLADPALRPISDRTRVDGIRQVHVMVTNLDPRDPDREVPMLVSIRLLAGRADADRLLPAGDAPLCAMIRIELLTIDRDRSVAVLKEGPETIEGACICCRKWLTDALGNLRVQPRDAAERDVLTHALITLLFNTTAAPGLIEGRLASFPSRGGYPTHFLWDACFHMLALEDMAPRLARDALLLISDMMRPDGLMPHFICSTWIRPDASQPPLFGWAAERLVTRTGDLDLAAEVLPAMQRNTDWWLAQRMTPAGLISCFDPFETGWDDTPRLDHGPILATDMNAYLLMQMRSAGRLAGLLGRGGEAARITAQANDYAARIADALPLADRAADHFPTNLP